MLDSALTSIFGTAESLVAGVSTIDFLLCCAASIVLGLSLIHICCAGATSWCFVRAGTPRAHSSSSSSFMNSFTVGRMAPK